MVHKYKRVAPIYILGVKQLLSTKILVSINLYYKGHYCLHRILHCGPLHPNRSKRRHLLLDCRLCSWHHRQLEGESGHLHAGGQVFKLSNMLQSKTQGNVCACNLQQINNLVNKFNWRVFLQSNWFGRVVLNISSIQFPQRYRSGRVAHACDGKLLRMLRLFAVIAFALFDIGYNLANSNEDDGVSSTTSKWSGIIDWGCYIKVLLPSILKSKSKSNNKVSINWECLNLMGSVQLLGLKPWSSYVVLSVIPYCCQNGIKNQNDKVSVWAHMFGCLAGVMFGLVLLKDSREEVSYDE